MQFSDPRSTRATPLSQPKGVTEMNEVPAFLKKLGPNGLGEALRDITFVGEGFGCYENFTVRKDAREWTRKEVASLAKERLERIDDDDFIARAGKGYTFQEGTATVDVFWYWDGDGTLYFRVRDGNETIGEVVNDDCKKGHGWIEFADPNDM